jgi:cytoskeletal protein CcmA (bactofilin family)
VKSKKAKVKRPAIWRGRTKGRKGSALLVVLLIVMAITILSLGFLSRSDVELACGENMILKTQMDYLAESGLEHARGFILNDSNCLGDWAVPGRQLVDGSDDYYDVNVVKLSDCNYQITCNAYREKSGERIGQSSLEAELRLDPCIAFWAGATTTISQRVTIHGDVYCNGALTNSGTINGDVFADSLSGSITGRLKARGDLSLAWPQIVVGDYSHAQTITDPNLFGPYTGVVYCPKDINLSSDVNITGMLIVDANLTVTGSGNVITAGKDLPAMLVTGNLRIRTGSSLDVYGLAVVKGGVRNDTGGNVNISGGLFVQTTFTGFGYMTITAAPLKAAIYHWPGGVKDRWSPAAGAFFKSIGRL